MCGIAGFTWPDERLIRLMTGVLQHRGPDDSGLFVDDKVTRSVRSVGIVSSPVK